MSKRILVRFSADCYWGQLDGLFITNQSRLDYCIGKSAHFGEVLGKHSEVEFDLEPNDFTVITDEPELIDRLRVLFGGEDTLVGYNPMNLIHEDESEED